MQLALIGVGRWGTNIRKTVEQFSDVSLLATNDVNEVLKQKKLDGVLIATPGSTHADIALPFIKRGLSVFIEKPLTTDLKSAKRLQAAAKKSGSLIFTGHVHLYNPAYQAAKKAVASSGTIRTIFCEGTNNGPFRDDMSALWDWAPHDVAIALDLVGTLPSSVQAWGVSSLRLKSDLLDSAFIRLVFPKSIIATIAVSWLFPEKRKKVTIVAEKNSVVYDDTVAQKVAVYEKMGPAVAGQTVTRQEPVIAYPDYASTPPLQVELQAFINMIRTKKKPLTDIQNGLQVVQILAAAEKSIHLDGKAIPC